MMENKISHYEIIEKIGRNPAGNTFKARDTQTNQLVAIRLLPAELVSSASTRAHLKRQVQALRALSLEQVAPIHSLEHAKGNYFLVLDFVEGQALDGQIPAQGFALSRFLELAIPLAEAVGIAHERGLVHGALNSRNILLDSAGAVKILNFGLAMLQPHEQWVKTVGLARADLQAQAVYCAPEVNAGKPVDHRSDIFSMGALLYEMATGRRPFQGRTLEKISDATAHHAPGQISQLNPEFPRRLDFLIHACLEKDPARRLSSALELLQGLREIAAGPAASDIPRTSLAVLPLADLSPDKNKQYFCDGMAEEIINVLSRVKSLSVVPRAASFQFRNVAADNRAIGRKLQAATLLEGSVHKTANRLRLTAQLLDAESNSPLWVGRFDREASDVFAIQKEIVQAVVQTLQLAVNAGEAEAIDHTPTVDVQAYDYYLRGRQFVYQYGNLDIEFALQLFSRAIALDPNFALAYAGLADCWSYIYLYEERSDEVRQQASDASLRAVELEPHSPIVQTSRGVALSLCRQDQEAEEAFQTAIAMDGNLFETSYFYARHCFVRGEVEKALKMYEQARRVRPEDYQSPLLVAQLYEATGRAAEAKQSRLQGVELVERQLQANPKDVRALYMGANGLAALGDRQRARQWAAQALEMRPQDSMLLYNVGCIYSLLGLSEEALDCLEQAVKHGLTQKEWFLHDDNQDSLRELPRFKVLLQRLD